MNLVEDDITQSLESGYLLRAKVYDNFNKWEIFGGSHSYTAYCYKHLCWLLDEGDLQNQMTDRQSSICRKLAGPYGYTVYKALLTRRSK